MMQANRKGLVIDLQKGGNVPEYLYSDEDRLQQVLFNLLKNAVKYTNEGSITLRITKDQTETQMIMFQVEDTGIGIPLEKRVQLFKLFGGGNVDPAFFSSGQRSMAFFLSGNLEESKKKNSWIWIDNIKYAMQTLGSRTHSGI